MATTPTTATVVGQISDNSADIAHDAFGFFRDADQPVVFAFLIALVVIVALICAVIWLVKRKPDMVTADFAVGMVPIRAFEHTINEQARQYDSLRESIIEVSACMTQLSAAVSELTGYISAFREILTNTRTKDDKSQNGHGGSSLAAAE